MHCISIFLRGNLTVRFEESLLNLNANLNCFKQTSNPAGITGCRVATMLAETAQHHLESITLK